MGVQVQLRTAGGNGGAKRMQAPDLIRERIADMLRQLTPELVRRPGSAELLADAARWLSVPGGNVLFRKGDPSDSIFIVASGLLAAAIVEPDGSERIVARLGAGQLVGEMGCVTAQPRNATIRALRTSELLEITWTEIEKVVALDPSPLLAICRTVVDRMARAQEGRLPTFRPSTFAVVASGEAADERGFAERFKSTLAEFGSAFLMTQDIGLGMSAGDFNGIEKSHDYVVYLSERNSEAWTSRCIRQADMVIVFARGDHLSQPSFKLDSVAATGIPIVLVLEWPADALPTNTAAWLKITGATRHYHVRNPTHIGRVARLLTDRGVGLVLSGGGARGLAHLGVLKALRQQRIDIDVVMGTSIGAIIGSGIALEWDQDRLHSKIHEFIKVSPVWDLTVPKTSLFAGRILAGSLQRWFGDTQIEDTPIPYGCLSANINDGTPVVHTSGDLKTWVRASAALPGIFPFVEVDGQIHVDGGVLNNLPTDKMREAGAGFVMGVDVGADVLPERGHGAQAPPKLNILELLVRVGSIGNGALANTRRKHCDVLIVPEVSSIGLLNFKAYERAIEAGFSAAMEKMAEISGGGVSALAETLADPRL